MLNEDNAYSITERLAFPRISGSEGEKKAVKIILEEFKKAGYDEIQREEFKTSLFTWKLAEYFFLASCLIIITISLSFYSAPLISLTFSFIMLIGILKFLGIISNPKIRLFRNKNKNVNTENIYTNLKSKESKVNIIILAHHDTKSQVFPSYIRMISIIILVFGGFILLGIFIIFSLLKTFLIVNSQLIGNILFIFGLILAILAGANFLNKTGNKSPGAIDNAASVGSVIELARYYRENRLKKVNFTFLITGSEELNLGGAYYFIIHHKKEFDPKNTFFINFDLVGGKGKIFIVSADGIPKRRNESRLVEFFLKAGETHEINVESKYIPTGAWGDHEPIIKQGFEAIFVGSRGSEKKVHTIYDNMDLVSKQGLKNILIITDEVIKLINREFD